MSKTITLTDEDIAICDPPRNDKRARVIRAACYWERNNPSPDTRDFIRMRARERDKSSARKMLSPVFSMKKKIAECSIGDCVELVVKQYFR